MALAVKQTVILDLKLTCTNKRFVPMLSKTFVNMHASRQGSINQINPLAEGWDASNRNSCPHATQHSRPFSMHANLRTTAASTLQMLGVVDAPNQADATHIVGCMPPVAKPA